MKSKLKIGYACNIKGFYDLTFKSYTLKNLADDKIEKVISHNLDVLDRILDYNINNNIKLFRISSDIIPLASHVQFTYNWQSRFKAKLEAIGKKAHEYNIRLTIHPGQYTILNSIKEQVTTNAIAELNYHCELLELMKMDTTSKIVLHIGGIYNDKASAIQRFIKTYTKLNNNLKSRIVIENDDKYYTIEDVLAISELLSIPVVYDNLHHSINNTGYLVNDDYYWILQASKTWKLEDGIQKVHYSEQNPKKRIGSHAITINSLNFIKYIDSLENIELDIMLEVKDKNISALKASYLITPPTKFSIIEQEWAKYKYLILEYSPTIYQEIRELLKTKDVLLVSSFYQLIDQALELENSNSLINAYQHIWGYFKKDASDAEKQQFKKLCDVEMLNKEKIQKFILRLALKYNCEYVQKSYFLVY